MWRHAQWRAFTRYTVRFVYVVEICKHHKRESQERREFLKSATERLRDLFGRFLNRETVFENPVCSNY